MNKLAYAAYANEICRICGENISLSDIENDRAVFAGYSTNNESRSAHRTCFDTYPKREGEQTPKEWVIK